MSGIARADRARATLQASDQQARRLAVSEFVRPLALEAGAGTGKTRSLVSRLATWLLGPGWQDALDELAAERAAGRPAPAAEEVAARATEGVVAITFTDAAAAEMARRLGKLLAELAAGQASEDLEPLPAALAGIELGPRAAALGAVLPRLRLQTVHAFCQRLLAEHPFEAGLHPTLTVDADGELLERAATESLIGRLRARDERLTAIVAAGVDPAAIGAAVTTLVEAGISAAEAGGDRFAPDVCAGLLEPLGRALAETLPEWRRLAGGLGRRSILIAGAAGLEALAAALEGAPRDRDGLEQVAATARAVADDVRKVLRRWRREGLNPSETGLAGDRASELVASAARLEEAFDAVACLQPSFWEIARDALVPLLDEVRARLRRAGVLTFQDLLERAVELLRGSAAVRRALRRQLRQLLVDEFQDTDSRQCELLELLALGGPEGPAPGLFVVGDPKQSIYAWRNADLASYGRFLARLDEAGGRRAPLAVNFRSHRAILDEVERAIAPVLRFEAGVQPAFETLLPGVAAAPPFALAGRRAVEYWVSWDPDCHARQERTAAARAAEIEAEAIAADVARLHEAGVPYTDFALLLRSRGDLDVYLDALRRAGVPYAVEKDRSYYRRREVIDLACAVRAILDPADLLALVAFLRSPLVGVPDAAWIPLWRHGFAQAMVELADGGEPATGRLAAVIAAAAEDLPADAPPFADWPLALHEAASAVGALRAEFALLPAAEWIERLRARLLPEPVAAARFLGRFGTANVERLLADLERRLSAEADPARALGALSRALAERQQAEEARPPEAAGDAVAVMTIHTAKGLQFAHVYLAQAHKLPRRDEPVPELDVAPPAAGQAARRELVLFGAPSPGWRAATERRRRARVAETVRLLYVATTRAKQRLVICGCWPEQQSAPDLERALSFVDLLAHRRPELATLVEAGEIVSAEGVLWRLAGAPRAQDAPAPTPQPGAEPAVATAAPAAVESLAALRRDAVRRQSQARLWRASDVAAFVPDRDPEAAGAGVEPFAARVRGIALHRALELAPEAAEAPERWRAAVRAAGHFEGSPSPGWTDELETLTGSALWRRLGELAPHVIARELPLLVRAEAAGPDAPLDGWVGALDLLYRDPATGELVVADFKSDQLADDQAAAARAALYAPQLRLYGRAVAAALGLEQPPRLELWLLGLDRVVEVADEDSG